MKFYYIKALIVFSVLVFLFSCTGDYEDVNTNPYGVTPEDLEQDFNSLNVYFPEMIRGEVILGGNYQVNQTLSTDSWAGYSATPTDYSGGANNTTYRITWNRIWNEYYSGLMSPSFQAIKKARESNEPNFVAWAKLIRLYGIQKVASVYGPVIYTDYGKSATVSHYDSEEEFYNAAFKDLDSINNILEDEVEFGGFTEADVSSYNGDITKWLKLSNSLRLMLALRLTDVKPELAREQAEKAVSGPEGVFNSNDDTFKVDVGNEDHPLIIIGYLFDDTRMSATMESFLVGYKDPRTGVFWNPVDDDEQDELVAKHPEFPFKGIKNGAEIHDSNKRTSFSKPGEYFKSATDYTLLSYSDVEFMLAEAKLRGWNVGAQSVKDHYEEGVRASFEQWGATGVEQYLENNEDTPINYSDPVVDNSEQNAFEAQTDITVKWEESASKERKLERIITQKWIGGFPNSFKAWTDFRRTGYPKIEPVYKNYSDSQDGVIAPGDYIKRLRFVEDEYNANPQGVEEALNKLEGPDEIGTRLWWDVDKPNF